MKKQRSAHLKHESPKGMTGFEHVIVWIMITMISVSAWSLNTKQTVSSQEVCTEDSEHTNQ